MATNPPAKLNRGSHPVFTKPAAFDHLTGSVQPLRDAVPVLALAIHQGKKPECEQCDQREQLLPYLDGLLEVLASLRGLL